MLEIYNEQVRDLLNTKNKPPGGLPVRENAVKGFYGTALKDFFSFLSLGLMKYVHRFYGHNYCTRQLLK